MFRLIEIAIGIIVGLAFAVWMIVSWIITGLAALAAGLLGLMAFINLLTWWVSHHISNWQAFVQLSGQAAICAAVIFVLQFLPVLLANQRGPRMMPGR